MTSTKILTIIPHIDEKQDGKKMENYNETLFDEIAASISLRRLHLHSIQNTYFFVAYKLRIIAFISFIELLSRNRSQCT